ncbi:HNH endonuclease signature motif containing protein [Thermophagus sp. OGC60D27]|uniref:HNH endonuclease signature motif containing protein n=1 Tax=Thermophagus sp. OGC60D27 TaxID=3458415 RepID=UPI004037885C
MQRHYYTEAEKEYIRENYPNKPSKEIANHLGVSLKSVYNQARAMGLKKTKECVAEMARKSMQNPLHGGRKTQFKKGNIPFNKGMKGWCAPGCEKTWFKKGHEPHNTKYDGHTRTTKDGYIEIRVRKGEYRLLHRVIWEKAHGPIPKGYCLVFKDGNPKNVQLDNLELISREENLRRNSLLNLPEPVQELVRLKGILSRSINAKIKGQ